MMRDRPGGVGGGCDASRNGGPQQTPARRGGLILGVVLALLALPNTLGSGVRLAPATIAGDAHAGVSLPVGMEASATLTPRASRAQLLRVSFEWSYSRLEEEHRFAEAKQASPLMRFPAYRSIDELAEASASARGLEQMADAIARRHRDAVGTLSRRLAATPGLHEAHVIEALAEVARFEEPLELSADSYAIEANALDEMCGMLEILERTWGAWTHDPERGVEFDESVPDAVVFQYDRALGRVGALASRQMVIDARTRALSRSLHDE